MQWLHLNLDNFLLNRYCALESQRNEKDVEFFLSDELSLLNEVHQSILL